MRVAIMGSGGLGGLFGGLQARAGHNVSFIARGANLKALRENGLTVQLHDEEFHLDVQATDDPGEVGPVDAVWFCVKTYDAEAAARQIGPLTGPETIVLPLQNGVGTAEKLAALVGESHVLGAVNRGGATLVSPGVVAAKGLRRELMLGEPRGGSSERTQRLADSLVAAGIDVQLSPRIEVEIWDKFVVACLTLGLCALMRLPIAQILANPETAAFGEGILLEAEAVARAKGIELPTGTSQRWLQYLHERVRANPAVAGSMYFDLMQGRRLELEALNGAAVRLGRELGVPTPLNFAVYAALLPYVDGPPTLEHA